MRVQGCKNEPDLFSSQITLYRATKQVLSFLGLFSDGLLLRLCFNLLGVACFIWLCYYSTPVRVQQWNIVVSMSLSVYVSLSISQRTYVGTLLDFLCMLHLAIVAVFRWWHRDTLSDSGFMDNVSWPGRGNVNKSYIHGCGVYFLPVGLLQFTALQAAGHSTAQAAVCAECHCTTDHWYATQWSYLAAITRTPLATHLRVRQV